MTSNRSRRLYRSAKWTWLLTQCLLLPLSVLYLCRTVSSPFPSSLWQPLLILSAALFLVSWLIAHSLLAMYRFPLDTPTALRLVMGQPLTFLAIFLLGGLPLFAAFTTLYTTLLALLVCLAGLPFAAVRHGMTSPNRAMLALVVFLPGLYWLIWLFMPIYHTLMALPHWQRWLESLVLAANVLSTGRTLWGTTIFAVNNQTEVEYDEEWQHWAAPTIIGLILSAVLAATVGGLAR